MEILHGLSNDIPIIEHLKVSPKFIYANLKMNKSKLVYQKNNIMSNNAVYIKFILPILTHVIKRQYPSNYYYSINKCRPPKGDINKLIRSVYTG